MKAKRNFLVCILSLIYSIALTTSATPSSSPFQPAQLAPQQQQHISSPPPSPPPPFSHNISHSLFTTLSEYARIVDISYCVGVSGIYKPFQCASRCQEFPGWELISTWNTGPLMDDSCGFIALDRAGERVVVAFRGTYSLANTIVDLSSRPQVYVPYPGEEGKERKGKSGEREKGGKWWKQWSLSNGGIDSQKSRSQHTLPDQAKCLNCTVHSGFYSSWTHARPSIIPHVQAAITTHPTYKLHLVGHSLGGAVAALAGLELESKGFHPTITTFGEPRVGNLGLRNYIDAVFGLKESDAGEEGSRYRRVTHVGDPVPLLPLREWGFRMHAGEIYIQKAELTPSPHDLRRCEGDEDEACIAGSDEQVLSSLTTGTPRHANAHLPADILHLTPEQMIAAESAGLVPAPYKLWQPLFAHRDYFWRLGLCIPGGDPDNWGRRGRYESEEV